MGQISSFFVDDAEIQASSVTPELTPVRPQRAIGATAVPGIFGIRLTWDPMDGVDGRYRVLRCDGQSFLSLGTTGNET